MNELINILKYRLVWLNFLVALLLLLISFYNNWAVPVFFIVCSSFYDILGYHFTLIRRTTKMPERIIIKSYRINQLMFDVVLLILLGLYFGWVFSLCGAILKIFGVQDLLYYVFLKKQLPLKWTWMKWTPLGFIKGDLSRVEIILQGIFGVLICLLILIYY
jgi:hypothetical protein